MSTPDYINDKGASRRLAQSINDYWRKRGKPWVRAEVVTEIHGEGSVQHETYSIRSNIQFFWSKKGEYYGARPSTA